MLQANLGPGQAFEQLRGANPQTPLASPSSGHPNSHPEFPQALMQRQTCQPGAASAMLSQPSTVPPELRQQAIQKLQLQYLQQQQQQVGEQGALQRGMSVDLSAQPGSSRQSSGTVRRYSQSPTMPAQQLQQPALTPQQMMLLHHIQQVTAPARKSTVQFPVTRAARPKRFYLLLPNAMALVESRSEWSDICFHPTAPSWPASSSVATVTVAIRLHWVFCGFLQHTGESSGGQLHVPESEVQRRLLAQISSRGLLKPEHRFETAGLGNPLSCHTATTSHVLQNHGDATLRTQQQQRQQQQLQQQQMVAELVSHLLDCYPA